MKGKKFWVAIVLTLVVGLGSVIGYAVFRDQTITKTPQNHLLYAMVKSNDSNAVDMTTVTTYQLGDELTSMFYFMGMDSNQQKFVVDLLESLRTESRVKFAYDLEADENPLSLYSDVQLFLEDQQLFNVEMSYLQEEMLLNLASLTDSTLALSRGDVYDMIEVYTGMDFSEIKWSNYIRIFEMEQYESYKALTSNLSAYQDVYMRAFENLENQGKRQVETADGKKYRCDVLSIEMTMSEMMTFYAELIEVAGEDENFKNLAEEVMLAFTNELFNSGDYQLLGLTEDDRQMVEEELKDIFKNEFKTGMQSLVDEIRWSMRFVEDDFATYQVEFAIDSDYYIRGMNLIQNQQGMMITQSSVINHYGNDVKISPLVQRGEKFDVIEMVENPMMISLFVDSVMEKMTEHAHNQKAIDHTISIIQSKAVVLSEEDQATLTLVLDEVSNQMPMIAEMLGEFDSQDLMEMIQMMFIFGPSYLLW